MFILIVNLIVKYYLIFFQGKIIENLIPQVQIIPLKYFFFPKSLSLDL